MESSTLDKIKITQNLLKKYYSLHFRRGTRKPEFIMFEFEGDLQGAIGRARHHCELMDFKFCGCFPFITNLDDLERQRNLVAGTRVSSS